MEIIFIVMSVIAAIVLLIVFRKHLLKIGVGIGIIIAGWFGISNPELLPDIIDVVVQDPIEQTKDTIGKIYNIQLSEVGDQTISLQEQIDAIPDGTADSWNVIQFPEGRFWTEGDSVYRHHKDDGIITLWNRNYIVIRGPSKENKTTFYTKAPATPYGGNVGKNDYSYRRHIWIRFSSNIVIENIKIEGSNNIDGRLIGTTPELTPEFWKGGPDTGSIAGSCAYKSYWEQEHALDVRASTNVIVKNFDVDGVWGDGIYVGGDQRYSDVLGRNEWVESVNTTISNCHLRYTGRQGIAVGNNVRNVLIEYVYGELGRRAFIDLEPDLTVNYIKGVTIRHCKTNTAQTVIAAVGNGEVSDVHIHNVDAYGGGHFLICYDSLSRTRRKNWLIENCSRTLGRFGSPIADIRMGLTDNVTIRNNKMNVSEVQSLKSAEFTDCKNVKIHDNDFAYGKYIINRGSEIEITNNTPKQEIK